MRICITAEGFFSGKSGGMPGRLCRYMQAMPEHEFVIWTVEEEPGNGGGCRDMALPGNVKEVREVFPGRVWALPAVREKRPPGTEGMHTLLEFAGGREPDWEVLFRMCREKGFSPMGLLRGGALHEAVGELCRRWYPDAGFLELYFTAGELVLPALYLLGSSVPAADIYHASTAGYAGLLGRLGSHVNGVPLVLTWHGTHAGQMEGGAARIRQMQPESRELAVSFLRMLSRAAYRDASVVTCTHAGVRVPEGCDRGKCRVIPDGILYRHPAAAAPGTGNRYMDIGVLSRISPDGDLETLLHAFRKLKKSIPGARLYITGEAEDPGYAAKCHALAGQLMLRDVFFTGRVDMEKWAGRFDFTVMCSLSGGFPVELLESLAAGRPAVVTDAEGCREVILGPEGDMAGPSGYCVPSGDREALYDAMERMCVFREERRRMGEAAGKRVRRFYRHEDMVRKYREVYREAAGKADGSRN